MSAKKQKNTKPWRQIQNELADKNGLAVVIAEKEGLYGNIESNNNSICKVLSSSEKFAPECDRYCGKVYKHVVESKKPLKYKCHAGLECIAVPVCEDKGKKFVAITGRAFTRTEDYRAATERSIKGDWQGLPPIDLFENVLMTSSSRNIETLGKRLANLSKSEREALHSAKKQQINSKATAKDLKPIEKAEDHRGKAAPKEKFAGLAKDLSKGPAADPELNKNLAAKSSRDAKEVAAWRSFFSSMLGMTYKQASLSVLKFVNKRYGISSMAWLENNNNQLETTIASGVLKSQKIKISLPTDDKKLTSLFQKESSIELKDRGGHDGDDSQAVRLFPILVGGDVRSALVIGEKADDPNLRRHISRFCETIAPELEILRLRDEISRRSWLDLTLQKFNEGLKMIDSEDFWVRLMQNTAELLGAERGSLLVYDEEDENLKVKAAIGPKADFIKQDRKNIGQRIARTVWNSGKALVVPDIGKLGITPAPTNWKYKSQSFICYPLTIGNRKIGVLNVADKVDGGVYNNFDLQLLNSIGPQIAIAIDRANLKLLAGEFEQLSVTDALTGLLNRRYLEERLTEEIKRSNRHGYQMSFMMI
ncbi:MAG: GAF domain-containing protein, partial [Pyrinomonadaceae bacterium]|nr:GAF domain-containing protein [Pyrinomonadaceae bacterium]